MKKLTTIIITTLVIFASALTFYTDVHAEAIPCPLANCDLLENVERLTGLVRPIAIIALIGVIIYGGFTRLTAAGDPDKEKKSMQILTAGIVGFIIIVLAGIIVSFLGQLLGIPNIIDTPTAP